MVNSRHIWNCIALNECRCCTQLNATQRDSRVFIPSKRHVYTCFEFCWKYKTLFVYTQDIEHHSLGRWFIFAMNQGERGAHHSRNYNGLLSCTVPTAPGLNRNKWDDDDDDVTQTAKCSSFNSRPCTVFSRLANSTTTGSVLVQPAESPPYRQHHRHRSDTIRMNGG